jgi:hypothetical protein
VMDTPLQERTEAIFAEVAITSRACSRPIAGQH